MKSLMTMMRRGALPAALGIFLLLPAGACKKETPERAAAPQKAEKSPGAAAIDTGTSSASGEAPAASPRQMARDKILRKWTGDLDGMIQRRVIRVLTTYSKTNYFVDQGTQRGLVYDSFRMFEDDLNKKLKNTNIRVLVMILPVSHDDLIPALLEGRGDIVAAGTMVTDPRREQVDFTNPTQTGVSAIVVTGPGTSPVARVEDLAGKEVYLRSSMTTLQGVERFNAELAKKGLPPVKIRPAPEVLADEDILEMVNAGLVKTTIAFDYIAEFWQQVFPKLVLNRGAAVKTEGQIAMMIRKNSPQLKAELNEFLARYPEGSVQRNVLLNKYLKSVKYAKAATSKEEMAKLEQTLTIFRKYGEKYTLDYLLMMAQGYQESQLDQKAKSHVGAIGVMQVMPATGKDLKVGDITQVDPNIHAGVKYFRFMMDKYYANEPMDKLNKGLFTFASYNAGPGRISQMRQRAAQRGLDPNKWFNNVEVVAAESIGRETVQYVANIYKYYLAYQMLVEQREQRQKAKHEAAGKK
ncbi:MAG: transporter substrate-binding domain-containing protein [Acidobacteriia bacterium]|nr:transporter substrate-binding domain-containing protein [Terriglobia bacterium]